jgi:hypothetical protein
VEGNRYRVRNEARRKTPTRFVSLFSIVVFGLHLIRLPGPPVAPGSVEAELNAMLALDASGAGPAGSGDPMSGMGSPPPLPPLPSRSSSQYVEAPAASWEQPRSQISLDTMLKAEHALKDAICALQFQDPDTAVQLMRKALSILGASQ